MKIGSQIVLGFIVISLVLAATAWVSDRTTQEIREEQIQYVTETTQIVRLTSDMERMLYQSLVALNVIREWNEISDQNRAIQQLPSKVDQVRKFESSIAEFKRSSDRVQELIENNGTVPPDFILLNEKVRFYESLATEWLKLGNEEVDRATLMFLNSIQPYFLQNIIPLIQEVQEYAIEVQNERNQNLDMNLKKSRQWFVAFIVITFVIACIVAFYFYRFIAQKIQLLNESVRLAGEGDLSVRAEVSSNDEIGDLAEAFNEMIQNLEQNTVSRQYLNNIIESMDEALFVTDDHGRIQKVNESACEMLGFTDSELLGREMHSLFHITGEDTEELDAFMNQEVEFIRADGEPMPVAISASALRSSDNKDTGNILLATDISERLEKEAQIRESLREKEILLAEIHHRVKNNLAVISGLLQLQGYSVENKEVSQALLDSQTRIKSIALIHEMLYQNESLAYIRYDSYVEDLVEALSDMHENSSRDIELKLDLETISLNINQAIPCSLILNELITNAYKHAFQNDEAGTIGIRLNSDGKMVTIVVHDTGQGLNTNDGEQPTSLGFTLINTLTDQLQGSFEILKEDEKGSTFRLQFEAEN